MKKQIEQVKQFHNAFSIPILTDPQFPNGRVNLRADLINEEVKELNSAYSINNFGKELIDCVYVLIGTALEFGFADKLEEMFDEVHRSNMSKLGEDGKPVLREDGKVLKGKNYSPASIQLNPNEGHR